jgi:hypothetical protein
VTTFRFFGAKQAFACLTEAEVWAAIRLDDEDNEIVAEVTRLACILWKEVRAQARQESALPIHISRISVRCPIERVAVVIMLRYIETEADAAPDATLH